MSLPIKETMLLPVYYQLKSSITTNQVNEIDETSPSWMTPVSCYLSSGELPDNRAKARKIQVQAARFPLNNNQLYKRSLGGPILNASLNNRDSTYWQNSTMEYAEIIQVAGCVTAISDRPSSQKDPRLNNHNKPLALRSVGY